MQSKPRILGALAFAVCMFASAASADSKQFRQSSDYKFERHEARGRYSWWHFFKKAHRYHHDKGPGKGIDCKVPEIHTSGLPSMATIALGGVAIVLSRRGRRKGA